MDDGLAHDVTDFDTPVLASCTTFPAWALGLGVPLHAQFATTFPASALCRCCPKLTVTYEAP